MQTNFYRKAWLNVFCLAIISFLTLGAAAVPQAFGAADAPVSAERFGSWHGVGPNGGDVRALVIDPKDKNRLYFTTLDGHVYTSTDAGRSWRLLANFNRPQLILDNMIIDSRDSRTLYVSGHRHKEPGGFYKSTDGGASWREIKDMKNQAVYALFQSTLNPDMIVAGTYEGVFVSTNSGNDFKRVSDDKAAAVGVMNVNSIAVDPRNTDIIYAGTWYRPFKTTDAGKTWRVINKGMIDDSDVFAINIDPRNPDHIFASACSGIYESQNAGEQWKKVQGIPSTSRRTRDILQNPGKAGYVYAGTTEGFWVTSDGGASWAVVTTKQLETNAIAVHPDEPNKVYIGTNNYGVMVSNDYGKTFTQTNSGYSTRLTNSIVVDRENPNRLYASTINTATGGGFFFVSADGGRTWQASMGNYGRGTIAYSILQDEANPNLIYLGTNVGIYRSLDRGASWNLLTAPKTKAAPRGKRAAAPRGKTTAAAKKPAATVAAPAAKPVVRVAALTEKINELVPTNDGKNGMLAATDKGLYRTYDIAKGWELLSYGQSFNGQTLAVAVSEQKSDTIWAGTARSGLLVSRDNGQTWTQAEDIPSIVPISNIAIDPLRPDYVYVGTKLTFFLTRDGGRKWQRRGGGLPVGDYVSILINPNNTNELFVGSSLEIKGGAYHSVDGGMTWDRFDANLSSLPSNRIWALAFDPRNQNRLFIGSHSAGIYMVERGATAAVAQE